MWKSNLIRCCSLFKIGMMNMVWVVPLPSMPVTARIIIFLVRDPYEPSFATGTGGGGPSKICFINFYSCHCWETDIKITHDPTMTLSFQPIPPALFYPTCIDNCLCQFFGVPAYPQGSWSVVDHRKFNMDRTKWCFKNLAANTKYRYFPGRYLQCIFQTKKIWGCFHFYAQKDMEHQSGDVSFRWLLEPKKCHFKHVWNKIWSSKKTFPK